MIKLITSTILGFIGTILLIVLFNHLTDFQLHSFTLWFVIPVGGVLVGMGASSGLFLGHLWANKPLAKKQYLVGALLGLLAFVGIYYVDYLTTYVSPEKEINYSFKGDPISDFEIDGQQITFGKYLDLQNSSSKQQFYFRGRPVGESFETGAATNYFFFYFQLIVSALAGAVMGLVIIGNKRYCQNCKKYTKEKNLFRFDVDQYEKIVKELAGSIDDLPKLRGIIKNTKLKDDKVNAFAQVDLDYCPNCHDSQLHIKVMKRDSNGSFEEVDKFRQTIRVKEIISKALIIL